MATIGHTMWRSAVGLGLFAIITAGTIAVTQALTADRIEQQIRKAEASALFEIIPESRHDNNLLADRIALDPDPLLGTRKQTSGWIAREGGEPIGVILPVIARNGYSGDIDLLVGIDNGGEIMGVRVIQHRETPGLGDKIELKKSDWIRSFNGKSLDQPEPERWTVAKDGGAFDQFTGATITPKAVVEAVKQALIFFEDHRERLLAEPSPNQDRS